MRIMNYIKKTRELLFKRFIAHPSIEEGPD
jgi:hypothetical protein